MSKSIAELNQSDWNIKNHFSNIEQELKAINKSNINVNDVKENIPVLFQDLSKLNGIMARAVSTIAELNKTMNTENSNVDKHFVDIEHELKETLNQSIEVDISDIKKSMAGMFHDISNMNGTIESVVTVLSNESNN